MSLLYTRRTIGGITATRAMKRVLLVLLTDAVNLSGFTFTRAAGVGAGSVHVCLDRLEDAGWIAGEFEDGPSPRRRLYHLTPSGWNNAHDLLGLEPVVRHGAVLLDGLPPDHDE